MEINYHNVCIYFTLFSVFIYDDPSMICFQLGNHDNGRISTRLGKDITDALNMVSLLLPGTAVTYYGEEIGRILLL